LARHWIRRDRLDSQLSLTTQRRLTIVTGPPGAGKTALLADWARQGANGLVAWLSVEPADDEPGQFWRQVAAALGLDSSDHDLMIDLEAGRWADWRRWPASDGSLVFILDDFHLITDTSILESVERLVYQLPPRIRLVLAGRTTPELALPRAKLRGEASSIGDADLRFTIEEVGALIALVAGKFLPIDQLKILTDRTEGWAAGLHLSALALREADDPSEFIRGYSGAIAPVAEYLEHEMLLRQPPDLVEFLLQTSLLEYLSADLCQAVSGRADSAAILETLVKSNMFVTPVDPKNGEYRYHRLLADVLKRNLQRADPSLANQAHQQAGTWHQQRGDLRAATQHFAQGGDYDQAVALIHSSLLQRLDGNLSPEGATLAPAELPIVSNDADPYRVYLVAAALMRDGRVGDAAPLLSRLRTLTAHGADSEEWRGRIEFLWALEAEGRADARGMLDHGEIAAQLLAVRPETAGGSTQAVSSGDARLETMDEATAAQLPVLMARGHIWLGELDRAQALLTDHFGTRELAEAKQPSTLAALACGQGRLKVAYQLATTALELNQQLSSSGSSLLEARLALAEVLFEKSQLNQAQDHLEAALPLCRSAGGRHWAWAINIDLLRLLLARGQAGEALNRLGELRDIELRTPPPLHLCQKLNDIEIGCRVALGDWHGALLVARSVPAAELSPLTLAQVDLCSGRPDRALAALTRTTAAADANEIRRLIALASAQSQTGQEPEARHSLSRAVEAGRAEGYIRPFLEAAAQTVPLLRALMGTRPDPYVVELLSRLEQLTPENRGGATAVLEPLTDRERQVLGYLSSHLAQREIARDMYVSHNTVKTHIKAIYRKFGVISRMEAVAVARTHGLL
jgi:LuxR family maltose regulon positive regulatory protein